jgi:hypothetical protein
MSIVIEKVENFDKMSKEDAQSCIDQVVALCEENRIHLSKYGNCTGQGTLTSIQEYETDKRKNRLFSVDDVQRIYSAIPRLVAQRKTINKKTGSYGLKHAFEKIIGYCTNGETIMAMILYGFTANFGRDRHVNCCFNFKYLKTT